MVGAASLATSFALTAMAPMPRRPPKRTVYEDLGERVMLELGPGVGKYAPPTGQAPRVHFDWRVGVSGIIWRGPIKMTVGFSFEHAVPGWAGIDESLSPPFTGRYAFTEPENYRGQFFRFIPKFRIGAENSLAFGYLSVDPGYVLRVVPLRCQLDPCDTDRAIDHGLNLGLGLGFLFRIRDSGFSTGLEGSFDSAYVPAGHELLSPWNHGISAHAMLVWSI